VRRAPRWWTARALVGISAVVAFVGTALFALRTRTGQELDAAGFGLLAAPDAPAHLVRGLVAATALAVAAWALVSALRRRRGPGPRPPWGVFILALLAPLLTYASAVVLRDIALTRPDLGVEGYAQNTLPSGHTALVCALAIATVMLRRRPSRALVRCLVTLVVVAAWANVASMAHRPADVLAGALLAIVIGVAADTTSRIPVRGHRPAPARE